MPEGEPVKREARSLCCTQTPLVFLNTASAFFHVPLSLREMLMADDRGIAFAYRVREVCEAPLVVFFGASTLAGLAAETNFVQASSAYQPRNLYPG